MKKKSSKTRHDAIMGTVSVGHSYLTVSYDSSDGTLRLHEAEPDSLHLVRSYERASGKDKVLNSMKANDPNVSFDIWPQLKKSFDYLIAVDTNTRTVAGRRLSVAFAYYSPKPLNSMTNEIPFDPLGGFAMLDVKTHINPERLGWHLVLKHHFQDLSAKFRTGLIVDSELGNLKSINDRHSPYYRDYLLPKGVTMLYASDAASDQLPNQMIRYCDKAAESVFKYFGDDLSGLSHIGSDDDNCAGYAYLKNEQA